MKKLSYLIWTALIIFNFYIFEDGEYKNPFTFAALVMSIIYLNKEINKFDA